MIDEWSGLADLLANLIEKYASNLGIEDMPDPVLNERAEGTENTEKLGVENEAAA